MQHAVQVRVLKELLEQIDNGVNADAGVQLKIPTGAYTDPDLAEREWQTFFSEHAQLIGLSGDLPSPGSYLCVDDFGFPMLATRDTNGGFHAFLNACRHRGSQLKADRRGNATRFVCPFHGWTYTTQGQLHAITQAQDFGEIDHRCFNLIELPSVERDGLLWVHPRPDGTLDIDSLLGGLSPEIANWHAADRVFCGEKTLEKKMNWKLANDTFGETYHFARLHRDTLNNLFHGDALSYETFGPHHRFVFPSRGIASLRRKPESQWSTENVTTVLYYLFPNIQLSMSERQITLFRIYPIPGEPGRSRTCMSHYFSEEAMTHITGRDKTVIDASNVYDPGARNGNAIISPAASMEVVNSTLENEDYRMAENTQRTVETGLLDHLIFGRNEPALHHFHNTFRSALGLSPLETLE